MSRFTEIYSRSSTLKDISPELKPLLQKFFEVIVTSPSDLKSIKTEMVTLLFFLTTKKGRTDANVRTVDSFVGDEYWQDDWANLPEDFVLILSDMGGTLHDSISAPEIAKNFESTPEHLLKRAENLKIN